MRRRWFILADDLTGAADCAIAFARRGSTAELSWGIGPLGFSESADVIAFDANSRMLSAQSAAQTQQTALSKLYDGQRTLFKKIDSTMRGQPAAETAAVLKHICARTGSALGVLAPAFPDAKRTMIGGCVQVDGLPLEQTDLWRRDHGYASADLATMLATAGIDAHKVSLEVVRSDPAMLRAALESRTHAGTAVAICDAETNGDLRRIAAACLPMLDRTLLVGSAGLAHAFAAMEPETMREKLFPKQSDKGALIVVGSLAAASRAGARALANSGLAAHVSISAQTLLYDQDGCAALGRQAAALLDTGANVLVEISAEGEIDMSLGPQLAAVLASALSPALSRIGALAVTGGETASALLSQLGVHRLQLIDEIETGIAISISLGAVSIPVATKAGAFGDENSLIRMTNCISAISKRGNLQ
ncbi:MAG: hypothetical protein JWO15_3185 [Sphingomonadales bacterium]|jgi:uncharacterized protein YgbK (DUF1537 family)|nr:hypothetical protein [Sphingomonadales bacterium]